MNKDIPAITIPYDLRNFYKIKLSKLDLIALQNECDIRNIKYLKNESTIELINSLVDWKNVNKINNTFDSNTAEVLKGNNKSEEKEIKQGKEVIKRYKVAKDKDIPTTIPHDLKHFKVDSNKTEEKKVKEDKQENIIYNNNKAEEFSIISHNIRRFSKNCQCYNIPSLNERVELLTKCYIENGTSQGCFPDVFAIQECIVSAATKKKDKILSPAHELCESLNKKLPNIIKKIKEYSCFETNVIGPASEIGCFIYDSKKLELIACEIGVPISPHCRIFKGNTVTKLSPSFTGMCGFDDRELSKHTYIGHSGDKLFIRQPTYGLFQIINTNKKLLICSVHLKEDPSDELAYIYELFHSNPKELYDKHNITLILAGDMNLTCCKNIERQELRSFRNEDNYNFGLLPGKSGFANYTTNLGKTFLVTKTGKSQCYDNFIIPNFINIQSCLASIVELPSGFINFLNEKIKENYKNDNNYNTRSTKNSAFYAASMYFSDHKPIRLDFLI
jgi:hypothetical protein